MKKEEIKVGGIYTAKVNHRMVEVKVTNIKDGDYRRTFNQRAVSRTIYEGINLSTGRKVTFHSSIRFRSPVSASKQLAASELRRIEESYAYSITPEKQERSQELLKELGV